MRIGNRSSIIILFILSFVLLIQPAYAFDPLAFTKFLGFQLNDKDTLADVQKALGPATIISTGDGAASSDDIYYVTKDGSAVLNFNSGEMGGSTTLLGFSICKSSHFKFIKGQALKLTKNLDKITVQGVFLGMSKKSFDNLFKDKVNSTEPFDSPEITIKSKYSELSLNGHEKIFDKEENKTVDYDDAIMIHANFDNNGLYSFWVTRVVQN